MKGKAKKDFEKWYFERYQLTDVFRYFQFSKLSESMQYGVIVDWFDSVGIYINDQADSVGEEVYYAVIVNNLKCYSCGGIETRPQARQKAIDKAVSLYNNR